MREKRIIKKSSSDLPAPSSFTSESTLGASHGRSPGSDEMIRETPGSFSYPINIVGKKSGRRRSACSESSPGNSQSIRSGKGSWSVLRGLFNSTTSRFTDEGRRQLNKLAEQIDQDDARRAACFAWATREGCEVNFANEDAARKAVQGLTFSLRKVRLARLFGRDLEAYDNASFKVKTLLQQVIPNLVSIQRSDEDWQAWQTLVARLPDFVEAHTLWQKTGEDWVDYFFPHLRRTGAHINTHCESQHRFLGDGKAAVMAYALEHMGLVEYQSAVRRYIALLNKELSSSSPSQTKAISSDKLNALSASDAAYVESFGQKIKDIEIWKHLYSKQELGGFREKRCIVQPNCGAEELLQRAETARDCIFKDLAEAAGLIITQTKEFEVNEAQVKNGWNGEPRTGIKYTYPGGTDITQVVQRLESKFRSDLQVLKCSGKEGDEQSIHELEHAIVATRNMQKCQYTKAGESVELSEEATQYVIYSRVKSRTSTLMKIKRGFDAQVLGDYLGFMVRLQSPGHDDEIVRNLKKRNYRILEDDNYLNRPLRHKGGYRCRRLACLTPRNDLGVEIQIVIPELRDIGEITHLFYELTRLKKIQGHDGRYLVGEDDFVVLNQRANELSDHAFDQFEMRTRGGVAHLVAPDQLAESSAELTPGGRKRMARRSLTPAGMEEAVRENNLWRWSRCKGFISRAVVSLCAPCISLMPRPSPPSAPVSPKITVTDADPVERHYNFPEAIPLGRMATPLERISSLVKVKGKPVSLDELTGDLGQAQVQTINESIQNPERIRSMDELNTGLDDPVPDRESIWFDNDARNEVAGDDDDSESSSNIEL